MFKNRSLKVSLEKTSPTETENHISHLHRRQELESDIKMIKRHAKGAVAAGVAVYGAVKAIQTASEIAINIAPKR